jgi:hypothetical protein
MPVDEVEIGAIADALRGVLTKGLPATEATAGDLLPQLRSVYARAVVPSDKRSRITSLNKLIPRLIAAFQDSEYREAAQALFGLAPGSRGASLTDRRRRAAQLRNYSYEHFRDQIESEMLIGVATAVYDDLLNYRSRARRATESLEPTGDTPSLGPNDLTHEEELISRIWQHVYGLRAELIAYARLGDEIETQAVAEDHRQAVLRMESDLKELLNEYTGTYGDRLIGHGGAEFSRDALKRIAGWRL